MPAATGWNSAPTRRKNQKNPARETILFRRCAVRSLLRRSMEAGSSEALLEKTLRFFACFARVKAEL